MNKNLTDKIIFMMVALILLISMFVSVTVIKHIHEVSFNMGVLVEKVGTLEEQNPTIPTNKEER